MKCQANSYFEDGACKCLEGYFLIHGSCVRCGKDEVFSYEL